MKFPRAQHQGALFPLLLLAAVGVIVLSAVSTAAIVGWLPAAHSVATVLEEHAPPARGASSAAACADCATVVSVQPITLPGGASGLGAVAGGVVGGLLGNQIGGGRGRTLATVAGAGGGAYVGNQIEKDMNRKVRYRITVKTDEGGTRTFDEESARWKPGDRVSVTGGRLSTQPAGR